MSRSVRYQNPVIQEHLAGQYVAGLMTPRVRARTEALQEKIPTLDQVIKQWADTLAVIPAQLPEVNPSPKSWAAIDQQLGLSEVPKQAATEKTSWWQNLAFWRMTGIASLASCLCLAIAFGLFVSQSNEKINLLATAPKTPNYMAAMSPNQASDNTSDIRFVINAYEKTEKNPSRLFVQWSKNSPRKNKQRFHLWAEDRETGELTYIGEEPENGELWNLNKPTWTAVSNSGRLLATQNMHKPTKANTLFIGPCIQLNGWKNTAS